MTDWSEAGTTAAAANRWTALTTVTTENPDEPIDEPGKPAASYFGSRAPDEMWI